VILKQTSLLNSDSPFVKSVAFCTYSISTMQSCHLWNKDEERNFIRYMQRFNTNVQRLLGAIIFLPVSPREYFEDLLLLLNLSERT
jgi:hypothetical protein